MSKISKHIKALTGYDRVMIYKFDEQYNGEVFAESREEQFESFLGLHYPHTDIPPQARELYLKNLVRMISDIDYTPIPILTWEKTDSHASLDLSLSVLRSVSPIHISYLKNMGVGATLTISLILENKLWGLIACHHYSKKNLSFYSRISALLQGQLLTSQIRVQETAVNFILKRKLETYLNSFQTLLNAEDNGQLSVIQLIEMTQSDGFICTSLTEPILVGEIAKQQEAQQIIERLKNMDVEEFKSSSVSRDLGLESTGGIAGILYYRVDDNTQAMWIRKEVNQEIKWAGNPHKAIEKDAGGLSPRKSFESWKEVIKGNSRPWSDVEVDIARQCIFLLQKHYSYLKGKQVQRQQEELLNKLRLANEELENINWISTHDLKEPLRKIRIFASLLMDDERFDLDESTQKMIDRISNSASRMQRLLDDLLNLNRTKHVEQHYEEVDLSQLISDLVDTYDWEEHMFNLQPGMPKVKGNAFLLGQLFTNLINNSIKFASPERPLIISLGYREVDETMLELRFSDNGMGFENKYAESMFKVFFKLNDEFPREGSGVGLAICKKVVELHNGKIWSEGHPNEGATFFIQLLKA